VLLAVAAGADYQTAAQTAGRKSGDAVSHLVARFNREGLAALDLKHAGGRVPTYDATAILAELPTLPPRADPSRDAWERWQTGLTVRITLPENLPPLRILLAMDNLAGHRTPEFVLWLFTHGVMPLDTPLGGSWLNMAESIQRVLKRRALEGQHPTSTDEVIERWESVAKHGNASPTPFLWGGTRAARRKRARERRHSVGGSGAFTRQPIRRRYGHMRDK